MFNFKVQKNDDGTTYAWSYDDGHELEVVFTPKQAVVMYVTVIWADHEILQTKTTHWI